MQATEFTPWASTIGGAMIGLSAVLLLALRGRIAGISGIVAQVLPPYADRETGGRLLFLAGLVAAPVIYALLHGQPAPFSVTGNIAVLIVGGLLVGFGTVMGSGCTSGHGICGLSRFSLRSLVAVMVFMIFAIATVFVTRHMMGGVQ